MAELGFRQVALVRSVPARDRGERDLILRAQRYEAEALADLFDGHFDGLYRYVHALLADHPRHRGDRSQGLSAGSRRPAPLPPLRERLRHLAGADRQRRAERVGPSGRRPGAHAGTRPSARGPPPGGDPRPHARPARRARASLRRRPSCRRRGEGDRAGIGPRGALQHRALLALHRTLTGEPEPAPGRRRPHGGHLGHPGQSQARGSWRPRSPGARPAWPSPRQSAATLRRRSWS